MNTHDAGMHESLQRRKVTTQLISQTAGRRRISRRNDLQRDLGSKHRIFGQPDFGAAATTEHTDQTKAPGQHQTRCKF